LNRRPRKAPPSALTGDGPEKFYGDFNNSNRHTGGSAAIGGNSPGITQNGNDMSDDTMRPGGAGRVNEDMNANIAGVLATYLSIMSVFAVCEYYIEKLLLFRKKADAAKRGEPGKILIN
jgi:hypothetical protein